MLNRVFCQTTKLLNITCKYNFIKNQLMTHTIFLTNLEIFLESYPVKCNKNTVYRVNLLNYFYTKVRILRVTINYKYLILFLNRTQSIKMVMV